MKRFKINWAIPGLLAMIIVIAAVAWIQSQASFSPEPAKQAAECAACHGMDTHVTAWKDSDHKDVACTACHAESGALGWTKLQIQKVEMYLHKDTVDLSQIKADVPNERCLSCHAKQMPWVMQDLKPARLDANGEPIRVDRSQLEFLPATAGHDVHLTLDKPLKCTDCHAGVSHGPAPTDRSAQIEAMHNICLDCHAKQNVAVPVRTSISCSACHLDLEKVAPADHSSAAFRQSHGKSAEQDPATCSQCHLNPGIAGTGDKSPHTTTTAAAARDPKVPQLPPASLKVPEHGLSDNCAACHGTTMPHPAQWLQTHAQGFKDSPALCASCHGTRDQGFNMTFKSDPRTLPTTDPSCTNCHAQPMPHPADYLANGHAQAAQAAPLTCEQCHSPANPANPNSPHAKATFCQDCHLSKFAHPSGYVFQHKDVLARYGNNQNAAGCTQCHTPTTNSCTACHTGGVGTKTQWHPADWVATHKETLAASGNNQVTAGCTQCHPTDDKANTTGLSCTACHKDGVAKPTQWHPANWWITHAQTTKPSDEATCNKCHSYVEPSCTQCHSNFRL